MSSMIYCFGFGGREVRGKRPDRGQKKTKKFPKPKHTRIHTHLISGKIWGLLECRHTPEHTPAGRGEAGVYQVTTDTKEKNRI